MHIRPVMFMIASLCTVFPVYFYIWRERCIPPKPSEPIKVLVAHFQVYWKVAGVRADVLGVPFDCNHRDWSSCDVLEVSI
jgi:hypothetical protein